MTEVQNDIQIETLVNYFEDSEEASRDARRTSERCRDYYDNIQLTREELSALKARKQPPVVLNMIASQIDSLLGLERQSRTDPRAYPRTPDSEDAANAVTDALRYVLDNNDFDLRASEVYEGMLVEGTGGVSVEVKKTPRGEIEIALLPFRWDRFYFDPYSLKRSFKDARYTGVVVWKDEDEAIQRWPKAKDSITAGMELARGSETYDDKPNDISCHWYDSKRKRVMCCDIYFKHKGVWHHGIHTKDAWLEEPKPSAYLDEDGLPENPHVAVSAKVKRNGQRYGHVESLLDPQDEVNKRRSKSLHISTTRQTFSKEGALEDINAFKSEAQKPDGHLEFPNHGEFGRDFGFVPNDGMDAAQFNFYQDSKEFIQTVRQSEALGGKSDNLSGKAIQSLQQGGMTEIAPLRDTHAHWKKAIYRAVWNRIKQFWREEKWIRVTDDEDNLRFVGLNQPITKAEQMLVDKTGMKVKEIREQGKDRLEIVYQQRPDLREPVATENDVAEMDVDIIVEEVPDTVNRQAEEFDQLVNMFTANPEGIPWEYVVQMSSLRGKDKILKKDLTPEEKAAQEQESAIREEAMQLEKAEKTTEIQGKRADMAKTLAEAEGQKIENKLMTVAQ